MELNNQKGFVEKGFQLTLLLLLVYWCLEILSPFLLILLWALIIAVTLYPVQKRFVHKRHLKPKWSAILITIFLLVVFVFPISLVVQAVVYELDYLIGQAGQHDWQLPPPPESVATWPIVGKEVFGIWEEASENLSDFLQKYSKQITKAGTWLAGKLAGISLALLQIVVAIIIGGVMLNNSEMAEKTLTRVFDRLMEDRGQHMLKVAGTTIRNVARGILGIAFIQSMLAGLGMFIAGVPGAAFLTLLGLFMGIIQIGMFPVTLIVILWAWPNMEPLPATIITIYMIVVGLIDNVLKPVFLGKGKEMPMVVVFLGAIGGFIAYGLIGLFVGAVVLVLAWQLFRVWIGVNVPSSTSTED
jgi:predicted PurR-regulated permease PerM